MTLHISSISDSAINFVDNKYVKVTTTHLIIDQLKQKHEQNQAILEIALALSYVYFDDLKDFDSVDKMWDKLKTIYGDDDNVLRAKSEILG